MQVIDCILNGREERIRTSDPLVPKIGFTTVRSVSHVCTALSPLLLAATVQFWEQKGNKRSQRHIGHKIGHNAMREMPQAFARSRAQRIGPPTGIKQTRNKPETQDSSKP
jgi:hypothetical protein